MAGKILTPYNGYLTFLCVGYFALWKVFNLVNCFAGAISTIFMQLATQLCSN